METDIFSLPKKAERLIQIKDMRKGAKWIGMVIGILFLASCSSSKEIVYFQDIDQMQPKAFAAEYEAIIKKDDKLAIVVSGPDKTVTAPYNLTLGEMSTTSGSVSSTNPENATLSYLVDPQGNIEFPILGTIHVEGMTRNELTEYLTERIGQDVKNPVVYVAFKNYKITVLGEVRTPGTFVMDSEKISILQALGRAGDLTLTAKRDGIILLREVGGRQEHFTIDLRDSEILDSPYFYLQQNDVLYIPPSAARVANATMANSVWSILLSSITTSIALISLIFK